MELHEKVEKLQNENFSEFIKTREKVEKELSDKQGMWCVCGRLATGLHERSCRNFQNKVLAETVERMEICEKWLNGKTVNMLKHSVLY